MTRPRHLPEEADPARPPGASSIPPNSGVGPSTAATRTVVSQPYLPGDLIAGKYALGRVIGEGGMGSVWLARNTTLEVDVAIKLLRHDFAMPDAAARLLQEARSAARLGHPSIVRVFDFGQTERDDPFIVMEVLDGDSLGEVIDRNGRLAALTAVRILLPVASALEAAHAQGIIHRDMKPDNVVLVPSEAGAIVPKIVDFGIAKLRRNDVPRELTQAGAVLGSPDYMSPEQARGLRDIDHRADVWALAVMLYEAIAGRRPFAGHNYNALMMSVIDDAPLPTTSFAAGDDALWEIVRRGLAKSPTDRWPTMRAFGEALATWALERGATDDIAGSSLRSHWLTADEAVGPLSGSDRLATAAIDANLARTSRITPRPTRPYASVSDEEGGNAISRREPSGPAPGVSRGAESRSSLATLAPPPMPAEALMADGTAKVPTARRVWIITGVIATALALALAYALTGARPAARTSSEVVRDAASTPEVPREPLRAEVPASEPPPATAAKTASAEPAPKATAQSAPKKAATPAGSRKAHGLPLPTDPNF